ncbi:MAG: DHHA1 domain-containing protein [Nanoarchaeota archaeon]
MLQKAADFLRHCNPEETAIVYHKGCGDGICAAAILGKFFQKTKQAIPRKFLSLGYDEHLEDFAKKLLLLDVTTLIFTDLSIDKYPELLEKLAKKFQLLILDHHTVINNMNEKNILHVHAQFFSKIPGARYCGSKLTYDACSKITDMSDAGWLAIAGIVNDVGGEAWKDFFDDVYKKFPYLKGGDDIYGFHSTVGKLVSLLNASKVGVAKEVRTIKLCINTEDPRDILEFKSDIAKELNYWRSKMDKEIENYTQNWKNLSEIFPKTNLALLEIKTKLPIASAVSTSLSLDNPEYIFCIYKKKTNQVIFSIRSQGDRVNCHELAIEATKNFEDGAGGGHPRAAGARVLRKDFELFKAQLPEIVEKMVK